MSVATTRRFVIEDPLVRITSPAPRAIWEHTLAKDPNALVTQSPDWFETICESENYVDASRLYEIPGRGTFILPLVRSRNLPMVAATLYSPPYSWGMGGVIGDVPATAQDLEIIFNDLAKLPGLRKLIRPNPLAFSEWNQMTAPGLTVVPRRAHVLDLQSGFDHIWTKKFDSNTRRNVRKAESSGLTVECDTTGRLVPAFYHLFEQSVERWADHQHEPYWLAKLRAHRRDPRSKFELITKKLGAACRIWMAWKNNEPVAAILVLQGTNAHYTRGVMNVDLAGPTRANDLLHRHAIEDACLAGCKHYHMGETGQSDSLARFKGRLGAEPVSYAEFHIERIPVTAMDKKLRSIVKKAIGFKDV